jgi:hypothetical protein
MKWFMGTYTARFNRRHKWFGHLFSGRYKALVVDAASPGYFRMVCEYVHLNPVRAKLLTPEQALREYVWSSFPEYLKPPKRRWPWLRVERLLGELRLPKDSAASRQEFERQMETRRRQEGDEAEWAAIRRGWFFGDDALKRELLAQASERVGAQNYGAERQESGEAKAERLVAEELVKLGWTVRVSLGSYLNMQHLRDITVGPKLLTIRFRPYCLAGLMECPRRCLCHHLLRQHPSRDQRYGFIGVVSEWQLVKPLKICGSAGRRRCSCSNDFGGRSPGNDGDDASSEDRVWGAV